MSINAKPNLYNVEKNNITRLVYPHLLYEVFFKLITITLVLLKY